MTTTISQKILLNATPRILRFAIHQLVQIGMIEATLVGPLEDLKGLINVYHHDPTDYSLLESLDVPKFNLIIESVVTIHDQIESFLNIYGLDEDECEKDEEALDFAETFHQPFTWGDKDDFQFWETAWMYLMTMGLIDELIALHEHQQFEIDDEVFIKFEERYLEDRHYAYPMPENPSAAMTVLQELYVEMEQAYIEIQNFEDRQK